MKLGVPELLFIGLIIVTPIACILNWLKAWQRYRDRQPLLVRAHWRQVPWGLADLGVACVLFALCVAGGMTAVQQWAGIPAAAVAELPSAQQGTVFLVFSTSTLIATALAFAWLAMRYPERTASLGFDMRQIVPDIVLGARWFSMIVVPVLFLQLLVTQFYPTKHPLMTMLLESQDRSLLLIAAYSAVAVAPFAEESLFRLMLQGWFERLQMETIQLGIGLPGDQTDTVAATGPAADATGFDFRPPEHESSHQPGPTSIADGDLVAADEHDVPEQRDRTYWAPIVFSSGLFAVAHWQNGPDWLPLFFLALVLGYLYQRTRRIQACIVVHMLVNSVAVLQLWVAMRAQ